MNCGSSGSSTQKSRFGSKSSLLASKALLGFLQYKTAEGLSPNTLVNYEHSPKVWAERTGAKPIHQITSDDLRQYLAWLRTEYEPRRLSGRNGLLSPKTLRNAFITLCAFFAWASKEFGISNPMKAVPLPKFEEPPIEPFNKEQLEALLKVTEFRREANTDRRRKFAARRATAKRDRAIILILLDTGLRASELCALTMSDLDEKTGRVQIKHGVAGGAKGGKGRVVYLGKATRSAVWRYLASREDGEDPNAFAFCVRNGRPLDKDELRHVLLKLGKKVGIDRCHPHRFRHTFAITYLRSGGDLFSLQALLGHNSLEMVQHYARIAEVDVAQAHRRASSADNWHL